MVYSTAPVNLVKGENAYPEYRDILGVLQDAAIQRAETIWPGFKFGGALPGPGEIGIAPIRARHVYGGGTATWNKSYGSQGSWAQVYSYTVPDDLVHAFAGFMIPDPTLIFSAMRFQIDDKLFPIINIELAHGYDGAFGFILKQDKGKELVVQEKRPVLVRAFQERGTRGRNQRVVPIGFALYRDKNLYITEGETGN